MSDWGRLIGYSRRYWPILLLSVVLMALVGAAHSAMALLIRPIIDLVLNPGAPEKRALLFTLWRPVYLNDLIPFGIHNVWTMVAFSIVFVFAAKGLLDYLANYLISFAGYSAITDLRNQVFAKVLRQSAAFFESNSTGRVMSSIMNDIDKIQVAVSTMLADLLRQVFTALGLLFVLVSCDWKLAVVSLTVLPFVLVPTLRIGRRIRSTSRRSQDHTGELSQILQETISGHQVVKAFGSEQYEAARFRRAAQRLLRTNLRYVLQQAMASPLIEFFAALTIVGLLTYARTQIKTGNFTAGEFTSFVIALLMLYEPVKRLTGIHNIFEQAAGASQKVFEYLDHAEEIADLPDARPLVGVSHSIVFDQVGFRYPTGNKPALEDVSFEVRSGEVVALVGPSGAGKSTLVSLLPRFHDVTAGRVTIDGLDVRRIQMASLRSRIGIVAQDTFLFDDTVANNIAYGRANVSPEAVRDAARAAMADEFIDRLPEAYETRIGERGLKLSGGQRQRISIARALLKNAPVLILDEATSHLDTESEMLVQRALANLMADRTVIVIAHRLSTIRRADRIIVLEDGRVAETGTHDALVTQGGVYQRLYELQYLERLASAVTREP